MTQLCEIMKKAGSDKGDDWHNYTLTYDVLFSDLRDSALNIFELGMGTNNRKYASFMKPQYTPGGSLRGWRDYFSRAQVYGADIDPDIMFTEDRIQTYRVDQTNPASISDLWSQESLVNVKFDIMIDDGLHTLPAAQTWFENSIHKLADDGIFIVEDIKFAEGPKYQKAFDKIVPAGMTYKYCKLQHKRNNNDNSVLIVINKDSQRFQKIVQAL